MVNKLIQKKFFTFSDQLKLAIEKTENYNLNVKKEYNDLYKRIIVILYETLNNCKNFKYFDLTHLLDKYDLGHQFLFDYLNDLNEEAKEYFKHQIMKYLINKTDLDKSYIDDFMLNIEKHPDLYEEMVNVLITGLDKYNKDNLITIDGHNIHTIIEKECVKLYEAYTIMINLKNGFKYELITTKISINC